MLFSKNWRKGRNTLSATARKSHKKWRKELLYRYCHRHQCQPCRTGIESLQYSNTFLILLSQKEHLKGGGLDVKMNDFDVY